MQFYPLGRPECSDRQRAGLLIPRCAGVDAGLSRPASLRPRMHRREQPVTGFADRAVPDALPGMENHSAR